MGQRFGSISILIIILLISSVANSQSRVFENKEGNYKISLPEKWKERVDGSTTDIFAPDDGEFDVWQEFVGISLSELNDLTLDEVFTYYLKEDFPGYYKNFKIEKQGTEVINGQKMNWVLYSFSSSSTVNGAPKTTTLYDIFYLTLKDKTLYSLNAIAVKEYYSKLEPDFLNIIRSFQINP
jgi:hypothetical protein